MHSNLDFMTKSPSNQQGENPNYEDESSTLPVVVLLIVDGTFHWMQNILAFTLMKIVNPLTYSVANVTKRIAVISGSLVMMKNEVNCRNVNECLDGTHECQHTCVDNIGSYDCACETGYELASDGRKCLDIDECENETHRNS